MRWLLVLVVLCACGKTAFSTERFACTATADCADGFECDLGECRAPDGEADAGAGVACEDAAPCRAGLSCVDGVCCTSACDAPCDSCNQPGFEGTCLPRPAGANAPSCSGYACDGLSSGCASTCSTADRDCNEGFTCVATTCGRCWSAVKNGFSQSNDPAWELSGATLGSGVLTISVASRNSQSSVSKAISTETLPLVGCRVTFEFAEAPAVVAGYQGRAELRGDTVSRLPSFGWQFDTRGLLASWAFADGGVGEHVVVPAGTAPPRFLRLEESGGEVRWRGANATTFNTLHAVAHDETLTGVKLEFSGRFPPQSGNERVSFSVDSLNSLP